MNKIKLLGLLALFTYSTVVFSKDDPFKIANSFGFELLKMNINSSDNLVYSPLSLNKINGMLFLGSSGEVKKTMNSKLQLSAKDYKVISSHLFALKKYDRMNMTIFNGVWLQKTYSVKGKYQSSLTDTYGFKLLSQDFAKYKDRSVDQLNKYISDNNKKFIKNVLSPVDITEETEYIALSGTNLYFNLIEAFKYKTDITFKEKIVKASGIIADKFYYETDTYKAISLDYEKNRYSIIFILPKETYNAETLVKSNLNTEEYYKILDGFGTKKVNILIPDFSFDESFDLKEMYSNAGLKDMFEGSSGFTGVCSNKINLDLIKQKVKFKFDGDITADQTNKQKDDDSRQVKFHVNKAFIYIIKDNQKNSIFLMGVINVL